MKYKYTGNGAYIDGLPMQDLDDAALSDDQKRLLELGITLGLYRAESASAKIAERETKKKEEAARQA